MSKKEELNACLMSYSQKSLVWENYVYYVLTLCNRYQEKKEFSLRITGLLDIQD